MQARIAGTKRWINCEKMPNWVYKWALVGTKEELEVPDNFENKPYEWSVALRMDHPLWGQNYGHTDTLQEAKDDVEKFNNKIREMLGQGVDV